LRRDALVSGFNGAVQVFLEVRRVTADVNPDGIAIEAISVKLE
jgi:hypothetical protein